jgi:hypothetical protein
VTREIAHQLWLGNGRAEESTGRRPAGRPAVEGHALAVMYRSTPLLPQRQLTSSRDS